jgi:hypothetical protein
MHKQKIVDANASSTCQVERVFAVTKVVELIITYCWVVTMEMEVLQFFRYYIITDGNASTGIAGRNL